MSEGVTALFIIWFILSIGIYVLHEVTEYMIWKYIYSILLIVVPFYLFLLPVEEWIPGEAASLEEQMLITALFLFLLFAVFWDYICSELEQKEKLANTCSEMSDEITSQLYAFDQIRSLYEE